MKNLQTQLFVLKSIAVVILLIGLNNGAFAQAHNAVKPKPIVKKKKAKAATPIVSVKIIADSLNLTGNTTDVVGSYQYSVVNLKFIISGNTPKANVPVKLMIEDYTTTANPLFNKIPTPSANFTTLMSKSLWGIGNTDTIIMPVTIRFKKVTNEKGVAYIKINGKPEFAKIVFNKPTPPKTKHAITLLDSNMSGQLDTIKLNGDDRVLVKSYLKLSKASGIDTTVSIIIDPGRWMQNMHLYVYGLKINTSDWSNKKDTSVTKNITLIVKQMRPIVDEQGIILSLNGSGDKHLVRLMPSKATAKTNVLHLVKSGNARIISSAKPQRVFTSSTSEIDSINVEVELKNDYDPLANKLAFGFFDTTLSKHFRIMNSPLAIDADQWTTGRLHIPLYVQTINLTDSLNNLKNVLLIIKGQENVESGSQRLKVTVRDKPFWAEIGTNFDLLDNVKTNNFYAGVYMFDKDIGRIRLWKIRDQYGKRVPKYFYLSFTGGVYEAQSVSTGSSLNNTFYYKDGSSTVYNNNGTIHQYKYYADTGIVKSTTQVKSIGLFFSPHLLLTNGKTEENGLHIYGSFYLEMLWQRVSAGLDYSKTKTISTILLDSTKAIPDVVPYKQQSFDLDYRSHYYGLGVPIYIKSNEYTLYINNVFGISNQGFLTVNGYNSLSNKQYNLNTGIDPYYMNLLSVAQPKSRWNNFYLIQYRLSEVAYGITFSGEVRGLILNGAKPVVTLALSKKFDLSGVLKPVVAKY